MRTGKPKWRKPRLLILVRGKKEEIILNTCKAGSVKVGPGNLEYWLGCRNSTPPDYVCHDNVWT